MHSLLRAWVENYSQHEHETIQDLCKSQQQAECPSVSEKYVTHCQSGRQTNHDERVCDGSEYVKFLLEDKGKYREDAAKEVDGHEDERDAEDCAVLVDLIELWPARDRMIEMT